MNKTLKMLIVALFISITVALAVGFFIGIEGIIEAFSNVRYEYFIIAIIVQMLAIVAITLRWRQIVKKTKIKIGFWKLFLINLAGLSMGNLTPSSRMGGEPLRAYFLNKYGSKTKDSGLATIVSEKIIEGTSFILISFLIILVVIQQVKVPAIIMSLLIMSFGACIFMVGVAAFIATNKNIASFIIRWIFSTFSFVFKWFKKNPKEIEKKIMKSSDKFIKDSSELMKEKKLWLYGTIMTFTAWMLDVGRVYFVFLALGYQINISIIFASLAISGIAGFVPIFPGGAGIMESTMIIIYRSSNITLAIAGTSTILDRIISYWMLTFMGLASAYYLGAKKKIRRVLK